MPKDQIALGQKKVDRMMKRVEFSKAPVQLNEKEYLQALQVLGVGQQEARFILGFGNGTVQGDALIPDTDSPG